MEKEVGDRVRYEQRGCLVRRGAAIPRGNTALHGQYTCSHFAGDVAELIGLD